MATRSYNKYKCFTNRNGYYNEIRLKHVEKTKNVQKQRSYLFLSTKFQQNKLHFVSAQQHLVVHAEKHYSKRRKCLLHLHLEEPRPVFSPVSLLFSALDCTFMMSCFTNNNRKARKERISFWFGLGPSENITGTKRELRQRPKPSAGEENCFHHVNLNEHQTETSVEKKTCASPA